MAAWTSALFAEGRDSLDQGCPGKDFKCCGPGKFFSCFFPWKYLLYFCQGEFLFLFFGLGIVFFVKYTLGLKKNKKQKNIYLVSKAREELGEGSIAAKGRRKLIEVKVWLKEEYSLHNWNASTVLIIHQHPHLEWNTEGRCREASSPSTLAILGYVCAPHHCWE